jgi:hypothetical protein
MCRINGRPCRIKVTLSRHKARAGHAPGRPALNAILELLISRVEFAPGWRPGKPKHNLPVHCHQVRPQDPYLAPRVLVHLGR